MNDTQIFHISLSFLSMQPSLGLHQRSNAIYSLTDEKKKKTSIKWQFTSLGFKLNVKIWEFIVIEN